MRFSLFKVHPPTRCLLEDPQGPGVRVSSRGPHDPGQDDTRTVGCSPGVEGIEGSFSSVKGVEKKSGHPSSTPFLTETFTSPSPGDHTDGTRRPSRSVCLPLQGRVVGETAERMRGNSKSTRSDPGGRVPTPSRPLGEAAQHGQVPREDTRREGEESPEIVIRDSH